MSWNYRVTIHPQHPISVQIGSNEIHLRIHAVYYDENGKPITYRAEGETVHGETLEHLKGVLDRMKEAITYPILWAGDKWPEEYTP